MRRIPVRVSLLVVFALVVLGFHSCMTFRMSSSKIDQYFSDHKVEGRQATVEADDYKIHYVSSGDEQKPLILFVHGSPGSLSAFIGFLTDSTLLTHHLLITTDRPGFGYSHFGTGEPSLQKQAASLKPILEKYQSNRPIILVGHSLGAPVIARMAMDYPDLVDGLIIVAGSIDPDLEPNETWFRAPLATPFLSWLLPRSLRASNDEIYQLKPELESMKPLWKNIRCPVTFIQGDKDRLVDPRNVQFAKEVLTSTTVTVISKEDMDHFVPWSNPELIVQAIEDFRVNSNRTVAATPDNN